MVEPLQWYSGRAVWFLNPWGLLRSRMELMTVGGTEAFICQLLGQGQSHFCAENHECYVVLVVSKASGREPRGVWRKCESWF